MRSLRDALTLEKTDFAPRKAFAFLPLKRKEGSCCPLLSAALYNTGSNAAPAPAPVQKAPKRSETKKSRRRGQEERRRAEEEVKKKERQPAAACLRRFL